MATQYPELSDKLAGFIARQHIFFAGTAAAGTRVNISPREIGCLRVLTPNRVAWLDQTGSGSETSAHLAADGRITLMFCAFQGPPMILRLYGTGRSVVRGTAEYAALLAGPFGGEEPPGARQIVVAEIDLVQTSCGYGVPLFEHTGERDTLRRWAESKGEAGMLAYRAEKNATSIDGLPSHLAGDAAP